MHNLGSNPLTGNDNIDIVLRNGRIIRETTASKWRWKPWDWGESDFDVVRWQYSSQIQDNREKSAA